MDYQEFAATLPAERTVEFTSPEELEEVFDQAGVEQPTRQLERGDFRARLAMSSTKNADLYSDRYSTAISMQLRLPPDRAAFLFPQSASGHFVANGEDIGNDKLLVFAGGCEADISGPACIGAESITMPESLFTELTEALCPTVDKPEVTGTLDGDPLQVQTLRQTFTRLVGQAESDIHEEDVANIVAETIVWMGDSLGLQTTDSPSSLAARYVIARLSRDYIEEHYFEAVHIADLCRVSAVGARTVQCSFHEHFQMTVSEYLKMVRLDSARRELAAADPRDETVTRAALNNGYHHLGRFSIEFRERFGVSPREVLTRRPGQKH